MADSRRSWARALFLALPDEAAQDAAAAVLEAVSEALRGRRAEDVDAFFRDPAVPGAERARVLASLYERAGGSGEAAQVFARFASLLVEKRRMPLLPAIASSFRAFLDGARGVARLEVVSARELTDAVLASIEAAWKAASGASTVVMDTTRDSALLGGFILRTGSVRYDWSTAGRLSRLRRELSRPLGEGRD